jgi:hypothetical protein
MASANCTPFGQILCCAAPFIARCEPVHTLMTYPIYTFAYPGCTWLGWSVDRDAPTHLFLQCPRRERPRFHLNGTRPSSDAFFFWRVLRLPSNRCQTRALSPPSINDAGPQAPRTGSILFPSTHFNHAPGNPQYRLRRHHLQPLINTAHELFQLHWLSYQRTAVVL